MKSDRIEFVHKEDTDELSIIFPCGQTVPPVSVNKVRVTGGFHHLIHGVIYHTSECLICLAAYEQEAYMDVVARAIHTTNLAAGLVAQ